MPVKPVPIALLAEEKPDWEGYRTVDGGFAPQARAVAAARETVDTDVAVIGAGIIGLTTAMHLAEAGVDVLVIDRGVPLAQASGANAGSLHGQMLSSDFGLHRDVASPAAHTIALQRLGIDEWRALETRLDADFEMQLTGGLVVADSAENLTYLERKVRLERQFGLDVEMLDRRALKELLPVVSDAMEGAAYCRSEGKINPLAAGPAILAAARSAGVRTLFQAGVTGIRVHRGGFDVDAGASRIRCSRLVNATGGWAAGVAELLGASLPVRTAPQQMIVTEAAGALVPMLVAAAGRHLTLKQVANGNVIIGGGWPADYDRERGRPMNLRESIEGNLWVAQHVIPALGSLRMLRSWATVGVMIDGAPILGEYPGIPGFFNGVGANGYTMGPIIGHILAGLIRGEAPPLDLTPFLVDRFR